MALERDLNEELVVQNERMQELGQQLYANKLFTERKYAENGELDVRIRTNLAFIKELEEKQEKIKTRVKAIKQWAFETDLHLRKYAPLQMAGFVFDGLMQTASKSA